MQLYAIPQLLQIRVVSVDQREVEKRQSGLAPHTAPQWIWTRCRYLQLGPFVHTHELQPCYNNVMTADENSHFIVSVCCNLLLYSWAAFSNHVIDICTTPDMVKSWHLKVFYRELKTSCFASYWGFTGLCILSPFPADIICGKLSLFFSQTLLISCFPWFAAFHVSTSLIGTTSSCWGSPCCLARGNLRCSHQLHFAHVPRYTWRVDMT